MALSASIALSIAGVSVSSVPREQKVRATLTVSNSGGSPIVLDNITPTIHSTSLSPSTEAPSAAMGTCQIDSNNPVPAGGSAIYVFDFTPHVSSLTSTFSIGSLISGGGVNISPTPATLTVTGS